MQVVSSLLYIVVYCVGNMNIFECILIIVQMTIKTNVNIEQKCMIKYIFIENLAGKLCRVRYGMWRLICRTYEYCM